MVVSGDREIGMFKEIDLSQAVPPNTVKITFRYEIKNQGGDVLPFAELADNAQGQDPVLLTGDSGKATVRLRTPQKLYYSLGDPCLHLNLTIVEYQALNKYSC
jgi:hypothetical protein